MTFTRLVPVLLAATLAGCGSFGAIGLGKSSAQTDPMIAPAPLPPVDSASLPPVDGTTPPPDGSVAGTLPGDGGLEPLPGGETAMLAPSSGGTGSGELGRTDLLGGWTIASSGDSCQLFMTLTSWTGGYRASTRGCNSDVLKSISAWNLQGKQVVLSGSGGAAVARLYASGNGRFDGQTEGGGAVSFYR
jgi:hypothetical protein